MKIRKLTKNENPPIDLLLSADPSEKMIRDYLKRGACFVAEMDKQIIGLFVLLKTSSNIVEIMNVAVVDEYQGKGIGKQLIYSAIEFAKKEGYEAIEIGTGNSSIGQLALYQKCGFRIFSIDYDFFTRHYSETIYEDGIHCRDMIRLTQKT